MDPTRVVHYVKVLPIVHCADCGQDVEFQKLTEHTCVNAPAVPVLPLFPYTSRGGMTNSGTALDNFRADSSDPRAIVASILPSLATTNTSPLSPTRSASECARPTLPFLEKYSKRKSASAPALLSRPMSPSNQQRISYRHSQQHTISPIIAAALSYSIDAPRQQRERRQREQQQSTPRTSTDKGVSTQPTIDESMEEMVCTYPIKQKPTRVLSQQSPVIPQKSAARTSTIASREPRTPIDSNTANGSGQELVSDRKTELDKDRDQRKSRRSVPVIGATSMSSAPSASSGMGRSGSPSSIASSSSMLSQGSNNLQNARSNSTASEGSNLSVCSEEQEDNSSDYYSYDLLADDQSPESPRYRKSFQLQSPRSSMSEEHNSWDIISEYNKALSPSLSPVEESEHDTETESSATYRPPTPPESMTSPSPVPPKDSLELTTNDTELTTKLSSEAAQTKSKGGKTNFKAMMEDLMQEFKSLPKRHRPTAAAEASESQESATTLPIPAPLRIRGARQSEDTQRTTNNPTPTQPRTTRSLLPPPAQSNSAQGDRNTPPTSGQEKVLCCADDTRSSPTHKPVHVPTARPSQDGRRPTSPAPAPAQTRTGQRESTRSPLLPGVVPPRDVRRSIDIRRPTSPLGVQTNVTRRFEGSKGSTSPTPVQKITPVDETSPIRLRETRRTVDVRSPTSPASVYTNVVHRIEETREPTTSTSIQTKVIHRDQGNRTVATPATTQPKTVRRSDDMRNPPPPSPDQPAVARRRDDHRPQRPVRESTTRATRAPEPEYRTERVIIHERSEPREHQVQPQPSRTREREPARERVREVVHTERIERSDKVERVERIPVVEKDDPENVMESKTSTAHPTRRRSGGNRGGYERCADCEQDILPSEQADSIKMIYGTYHFDCLKCVQCRCHLGNALEAHEYEGQVLCEEDFVKMIAMEIQRPQRFKSCAGCEGPILAHERTVYALDKPWHEHHLCCYHCLKAIPIAVRHVEKDGRIYCPRDYRELFTPKCRGCGLMIEKDAVSAQAGKLNGKWHAGCFRCTTCRRPFTDKKFYVFKDAPYCKRHYHRLNNSLCMRCDEPIEGSCIQTVEGWRFHSKCFSCSMCGTKLKENYYSFEEQTYCEKDMMYIQRTRNVHVERRMTMYQQV